MSHSLRYDVNCSILFTELPLLERPAAVKKAGFSAVEFWWPFAGPVPSDKEADALVTAVQDAGVQLVGLNFFAGDMPAGDRGVLSNPKRSNEFRDNIDATLGIGEQLGCTAFNALYGNRVDGAAVSEQDELAVENLALAASKSERINGTVLLEQRRDRACSDRLRQEREPGEEDVALRVREPDAGLAAREPGSLELDVVALELPVRVVGADADPQLAAVVEQHCLDFSARAGRGLDLGRRGQA